MRLSTNSFSRPYCVCIKVVCAAFDEMGLNTCLLVMFRQFSGIALVSFFFAFADFSFVLVHGVSYLYSKILLFYYFQFVFNLTSFQKLFHVSPVVPEKYFCDMGASRLPVTRPVTWCQCTVW